MKKLAFTAIAIAAAVACKSPAEPAAGDASFTPSVSDAAPSAAPSASAASPPPDASATSSEDAPGKYPAVDRFCAGSYGADLESARTFRRIFSESRPAPSSEISMLTCPPS